MSPGTNRDDEPEPPVEETLPRTLYWWRVPERPGVGRKMVINAVVWFVALVVVLIVIGVIVAAT